MRHSGILEFSIDNDGLYWATFRFTDDDLSLTPEQFAERYLAPAAAAIIQRSKENRVPKSTNEALRTNQSHVK